MASTPPTLGRPDPALYQGEGRVDGHGYFTEDELPLETAQGAAFHHIVRKLRTRPYQHILDAECDRGAFLAYACKHFGLTGHGLTSDPKAAEAAHERIRREGLEDQASVENRALESLVGEGEYDRVTLLGGLAQPGHRRLVPTLGAIQRLLKDNGLFLLEAATRRRSMARSQQDWLIPRIFSGGDPPSAGTIHILLEDMGLELQDTENLRRHAALTCATWTERLRAAGDEGRASTGEAAYREQLLELALRTTYFEEGRLHLHQYLATKDGAGFPPVPRTREDLYD